MKNSEEDDLSQQISLKLSHKFSEKLYLISDHNDVVGIAGNKSRISRSSNEIKQC